MATIYDIAKKTKFSAPTVSKALNGTGNLSEATRLLILNTAAELGYVPNLTARALSTQRSNLIGIVYWELYKFESPGTPFFPNILGSFNQVMMPYGYDVIFLPPSLGKKNLKSQEFENYRHIDGILIINLSSDDNYYNILRTCQLPCVSANDVIPGISTVITANYESAKTAVQHLIDLGHKKIAYIRGPVYKSSPPAKERQRGYKACLKENSMEYNPTLVEPSEIWEAQGGYDAVKRLLKRTKKISAIFASSDSLAFGILKALNEMGIRVPDDISIIGFDGDAIGEYISPSLTTMRVDAAKIGQVAGEMMIRKLAGEKSTDIIRVPAQLVIRNSCRTH